MDRLKSQKIFSRRIQMNNRDDNQSLLPVAIIGAVLSFLIGFYTFFLVDQKAPVNADKILNRVKAQFKEEGPIEGSWIEMTKVPWKKYSYETKVYYGGISRLEDGQVSQYEFVADAYTGTLMDVYKV